jgi:hypothetical protein
MITTHESAFAFEPSELSLCDDVAADKAQAIFEHVRSLYVDGRCSGSAFIMARDAYIDAIA